MTLHAPSIAVCIGLVFASLIQVKAQNEPIAIVPVVGTRLTGAMEVAEGKAIIAVSGTVTANEHAVTVTLPHRGNLRLCPTTKVSLAIDPGQSSQDKSGLMMALDRGALEASFATGRYSDIILTPDFRVIISGPGVASVYVRLGPKGDTCVDNRGTKAPYVSVSSVFDGGVYRVQPDQRVMFQHGSLNEVVDQEKESCGCPPEIPVSPTDNEFPLAQSAGLAPLPLPPPNVGSPGTVSAQATAQLSYDSTKPNQINAVVQTPSATPLPTPKPESKRGFLGNLGHFFKRIFGTKS